jgi:hypothetical protein
MKESEQSGIAPLAFSIIVSSRFHSLPILEVDQCLLLEYTQYPVVDLLSSKHLLFRSTVFGRVFFLPMIFPSDGFAGCATDSYCERSFPF